jgi:hypothetical protein
MKKGAIIEMSCDAREGCPGLLALTRQTLGTRLRVGLLRGAAGGPRETQELRDNDPIRREWYGEGQAVFGGAYHRPAVLPLPTDLSRGG